MPAWVGPVVAISLALIAVCYIGLAYLAVITLRKTAEQTATLGQELARIREELSPALTSLNRLGTQGAEVAGLARDEVQEMVRTAQRVRYDVERGMTRTRERLADFEAVVDLVQEEVEDAALDFTAALRTVRTGTGMIGRLRRLVLPRRRGGA